MHPILFRIPIGGGFPIYSYGVMLGLSFVVGWYLTLGLAERDKLPREVMANCYVITALAAVLGARLLYVLTNLDEFHSFGDIFEFRSGGMVAYGGFLGGFLGSLGYLRLKGIPLIPWADVAVPSLASGLMITRIGCYLYGCDFGRPLDESAAPWLRRAGTFPKWPEGTIESSIGSPAWAQHVKERGLSIASDASLPVHPTQLYESAIGLALLVFLLVLRKRQVFRGQIFLSFTFFYGVARFALEFLRDDAERGSMPPSLPPHILFPLSFVLFGAAFAYGFAPAIQNAALRNVARVAAFLPVVAAYLAFKPEPFAIVSAVKLSTSQFIGLGTGCVAAVFFAMLYDGAKGNPVAAMALPDFSAFDAEYGEEEDGGEKKPAAPKKKAAPKDDDESSEDEPKAKKPAKKAAEPSTPEQKKKKRKKKPETKPAAESDDASEESVARRSSRDSSPPEER